MENKLDLNVIKPIEEVKYLSAENASRYRVLTSKKEDMEILAKEREEFFKELFSKYQECKCIDWLKSLYEGTAVGVRAVNQRYLNDKDGLKKDIMYVCDAINNLPVYKGEKKRLPVFSSQIARNPHYFDSNTEAGSMFINALCTLLGLNEVKGSEEISELYYNVGIFRRLFKISFK